MIKDNIVDVKKRIAAACAKAGRGPDSVSLVAITKEREVEQIVEALEAGISDIGENRVQEAALKFKKISSAWQGDKIKFHMVGHLQNNKVKDAVKLFDLIHSVDSLNLAGEINKQAASLGKAQDILIQVNTSAEATKFGVTPEEALEMVLEAGKMKNISVCGLMTIAPLVDDPEKVRLYFRRLRELRDKIYQLRIIPRLRSGQANYQLRLSMGMTDDFEVAIEEGADIIRLGRAIFG